MVSENTNFFHTEGILLKRQPYKENSVLCRCLTKDFGIISIIASGVYKEKSSLTGILEPFSQVQMELYKTQKTQIYTLRSANIVKSYLYGVDYQNTLLVNAAGELLLQCEFLIGESIDFYELLVDFLNYLTKSEYHYFLIFSRFVLKFFSLLGISIEMCCSNCMTKEFTYFYPQQDGFLCANCYKPLQYKSLIQLKQETSYALCNIYSLKQTKEKTISQEIIDEIKNVFLIHLSNHYNKKFHLNSLSDYK
ncbi:MAG: DNA repair protein RecO [Candidatus Cloacimonetes bacterium]|nr:DNA repair protein RecO [Candidatus Cloacimonadota bacterium]